ncbi:MULTISPECIES: ribonuclease J [Bacillaceae]|uniref:Ribonuclease J n=1 Tax=Evansella alkalicola TaxID=745819 RepID=A0ABS6JVS9_9BACI|nr:MULTISPECIES: ribonuclease J [Bacillaceae]MBU9722687.1 ribonuclease J [Bacillus alkalicola]
MSNQQTEKIRLFSLGGIGEIGKNMYVIELDDEILVIDGGLMFPDDDMLGVDVVIPDITYLKENKDRVRGIILTHGHEDHIGAIPYILRDLDIPVYGTKLTLALVADHCRDLEVAISPKLVEINSDSKVRVGKTPVSFFRTTHSIPDSIGIIVHTSQGPIVHTGDFKFDQNPVDGKLTEIGKLADIGEKGVLCLLSDSTNAERPGITASESVVAKGLKEAFYNAPGRIFVATFSSNIHRIQQVINATTNNNRKLTVVGKSLEHVVNIGLGLGYLIDEQGIIININDALKSKDDDLVILTAGSQGEPLTSLSKMTNGSHSLKIKSTDRVIISASPISGNEKSFSKLIDMLSRLGTEIVYGQDYVHTSGHGSAEELKQMVNLIKPKYFVPIHGEYRMQHAHAQIAKTCGILSDNIFLLNRGESVEFIKKTANRGNNVPYGNVLIDGLGIGDVGNIVLRDRRLLSKDGIIVTVITLNKKRNQILSGPDIISRGFVYVRESEELIMNAESLVKSAVNDSIEHGLSDWSQLKQQIRDQLGRFLYEKTKRRPMIIPIIMEA